MTSQIQYSESLAISQLEQGYAGMHQIYTLMIQSTAFALGADAIVLGYAVPSKSAAALIFGGIVLLALYWHYYRAGQTLGALAAATLALERDMNIPLSRSGTTALILSFRGRRMLDKLLELQGKDDMAAKNWLSDSNAYAIFGSPHHLLRSKTAFVTLSVGMIQLLGAVYMATAQGWGL